jgi:hypothetical protein
MHPHSQEIELKSKMRERNKSWVVNLIVGPSSTYPLYDDISSERRI